MHLRQLLVGMVKVVVVVAVVGILIIVVAGMGARERSHTVRVKQPRRDDNLLSPRVNPLTRVVLRDSTADV